MVTIEALSISFVCIGYKAICIWKRIEEYGESFFFTRAPTFIPLDG